MLNNLNQDEICENIAKLEECKSFYEEKAKFDKKIIEKINTIIDLLEDIKKNEVQEKKESTEIVSKNYIEKQDNNVLLISEIQNEVKLPYKIEELNKILNSSENEYKSIQEIIDKKYRIPLVKYNCSSISRFREAFTLMKEKEKSSFMDAIDLAFELMGNRYLHPSIIAACENLDQLDIYLDCLDKNELEDFPFFEIKYELYPQKIGVKEFEYYNIPKKLSWDFLKSHNLKIYRKKRSQE